MIKKTRHRLPILATDKVEEYPVLPLKTGVLFPGMMLTLQVGQPTNLKLLENRSGKEKEFIAAYSPSNKELSEVGVVAIVRDKNQNRFHINKQGERLYKQNYKWISNFEDGIAVVQDKNAYMFHIKTNGMPLNKNKFIYVRTFVDGRAVVKDDEGMFNINKKGNRYYPEKYQYVMDYSNGVAEVYDGKNWKKIDINGNLIEEDFSDSEGMGVYWRQAIGPGQMPCASVLLGDVPLSDHPECAEMQKDLENSISR